MLNCNLASALLLTVALTAPCHAQVPDQTLAASGILTDMLGTPLVGPVSIVFSVHDAATAGTVLWTETHPAVALDAAGRYHVTLGSITPLVSGVFVDPNTWLSLNVSGDGEMTPRLPLGRVPTAHNAALLDGSPPSVFAPKAELIDLNPGTSPVDWGDLISIPAGFADDTDDVDDADADPTNELQSWGSLPGIPAGFADDTDNVDDADADPTNELQSWGTLPGIPAGFTDGIDNVDDADADPTNELQSWGTLPGIPAGFADNIDNVNDADADPTNELQTLSVNRTTGNLTISTGNTVNMWGDSFALAAHMVYSPDDILGFTVLSGDDVTASISLPFSWALAGVSYGSITLSSNGWFEFTGGGGSDLSNDCLPTTAHTQPFLAWYWDDLVTNRREIRYGTSGVAPNQVFIIDFECRTFSGSFNVSGQVQIHELSGLINVKYRAPMDFDATGQNATIGFQLNTTKAYPIVCNGKVLDDNLPDEGWSIVPIR